ncbi:MAG: flagellar basal body-associated protein FliL [Luteimonas sp.]
MSAAASPSASADPSPRKKKAVRSGKWKWIVVASVVLLGSGGGWWLWQARASSKPAPKAAIAHPAKAPAQYYALDPAFVVNLADTDSVRYLQADVQLMTRDPGTRAALETHAPAIRNRLLLLFGQQTAMQLSQRNGKEALQRQALSEVRAVLDGEGAPDRVEAVYFTSMVTQ